MMKLVIDRSRWLRGEGSSRSRLLRSSDGKMCCVGFFALACGLTPADILDRSTPFAQPSSGSAVLDEKFIDPDNPLRHVNEVSSLYATNDSMHITDASREHGIRGSFRRLGVEVTFE